MKKFKFHKQHIDVLKKFINVFPSLGFYKNYVSVYDPKRVISARFQFVDEEKYDFEPLGLKDAGKLLRIINYCGNDYSAEVIDSQSGEKAFALKISSPENSFRYILNRISDGTNVIPACQYDTIDKTFDKICAAKKTTSFNLKWEQFQELFEIKNIVNAKYFIFTPVVSKTNSFIKVTVGRMESDETYDSAENYINDVNFVNLSAPTKFEIDSSILMAEDYVVEVSEKMMKLTSASGVVYYIIAILASVK